MSAVYTKAQQLREAARPEQYSVWQLPVICRMCASLRYGKLFVH
jgi:hypothetical protein